MANKPAFDSKRAMQKIVLKVKIAYGTNILKELQIWEENLGFLFLGREQWVSQQLKVVFQEKLAYP
jgi:predicted HAD superfamily hydrolase